MPMRPQAQHARAFGGEGSGQFAGLLHPLAGQDLRSIHQHPLGMGSAEGLVNLLVLGAQQAAGGLNSVSLE